MPEQFVDEYSVADITEHQPKYKLEGGKLYLDGVQVFEWQLTPDELLEWFPSRYIEIYGPPVGRCPICEHPLAKRNKVCLYNHSRQKHPEWYQKHRPEMKSIVEVDEVFEYALLSWKEDNPEVENAQRAQ
jgi:hypothetical protein